MNNFGQMMKSVRKEKRVTLRKLGEYVGKSIGYLSDIENGRKRAPKLDIVLKIEECLGIVDGTLINLAAKMRRSMPQAKKLSEKLMAMPKLSEALLRADEDLTEDEFDELMKFLEKQKSGR
ncbi:MAG: helix-turn-helix transcriptional regulator [Proteobacteria bacterium]|nr:helix-turn-helix transcriptional regulator [Pseudomonadota bacterium]MBU1543993.1 helix-turn-helix transcriptional regulator [Pseudomonadota bacterium]MBU2481464.1 helix-turn-helix transcriptional regulator [Pseudomonadota bacterium]